MPYRVVFSSRAERLLRSLPRDIQDRVTARALQLGGEPRGAGTVKLKGGGNPPVYRVKVGRDYRIAYSVFDDEAVVVVVWVGNRRDAYRD